MTRTNLEFKLMLCLPVRWRDSRRAAASALPGQSVFNFRALGDMISELQGPLRTRNKQVDGFLPFCEHFHCMASDFLKFWAGCFLAGWKFADGIINIIGTLALLACGYLLWRKRNALRHALEEWSVRWAIGIFAVAFAISTICIAPFLKFQEADKRKTTQEKFDFINQNRPYLETELVVEGFDSTAIHYHFDVQNTGNLPAYLNTQEQKSEYIIFPDFQVTNRFLAPHGHMQIPSVPAFITNDTPLDLYVSYQANYQGTNLTFNDLFHFRLTRKVGNQYPQTDFPQLVGDPVRGTNTAISYLKSILNLPFAGFLLQVKDGKILIASTNRLFLYNSESRIVIFKSISANGSAIVLTSEINTNSGQHGWHSVTVDWDTNGAELYVDANHVSAPAHWPKPTPAGND